VRPSFEVRLFADDDGRPGEILYSWDAGDAFEYVGAPSLYWIQIYPAVELVTGATYWASVVAEAFDPQWGVVGSVPDGGATSVRSPHFGIETWTPLGEILPCDPCSMALFVFADSDCVTTPAARSHWTRLKAMFR